MPPLTVKLCSWPDLTTTTDLNTVTSRSCMDILNEPGAFQITVPLHGGEFELFNNDGNDVVVFYHGATRVFAGFVEGRSVSWVDQGEHAKEEATFKGRGLLSILEQAVMYPTINVERAPVETDRLFGWMNYFYPGEGAWDTVEDYGSIDDIAATFAFILGQPLADIEEYFYNIGFPSLELRTYWAPGYSALDAPAGTCYFREGLIVPADGDYYVFLWADDSGELYIDGQECVSLSGVNAVGLAQSLVTLTYGFHQVALRGFNDQFAEPGRNGGKVGFAVYTTQPVYLNPAGVAVGTKVWEMTGTAKVLAYPAAEPGMTPGNILRIGYEEAALETWVPGRVRLAPLTPTWTDTEDSAAVEWPLPLVNIGTKTGTDYNTWICREVAETYVDTAVDPETLDWHAWAIGTRGTTPGTTLAKGVNLLQFTSEAEFAPIDAVLLRWRGGWAERVDSGAVSTYGRREGTLEIGSPASIDEVYRVADGQFDAFAVLREEYTAVIRCTETADTPYDGFNVGDEIDTPAGMLRVRSIGLSSNNDGPAVVTVMLKDRILDENARLARAIQKGV